MEINSQVCSLELAKKLKSLGVKQESLWYWYVPKIDEKDSDLVLNSKGRILSRCGEFAEVHERISGFEIKEKYSAFTVAELGEMLPTREECISVKELSGDYRCGNQIQITEVDARAKMLIYLLENDLINKNNE